MKAAKWCKRYKGKMVDMQSHHINTPYHLFPSALVSNSGSRGRLQRHQHTNCNALPALQFRCARRYSPSYARRPGGRNEIRSLGTLAGVAGLQYVCSRRHMHALSRCSTSRVPFAGLRCVVSFSWLQARPTGAAREMPLADATVPPDR